MNVELMQKIHDDAFRASRDFFLGIEEGRRIGYEMWLDGLSDPIRLIVHRDRSDDGPPTWNVMLYRDWLDQSPRYITSWPTPIKFLFLEQADELRREYIDAIDKFEAMVRRRYGS